MKRVLLCCLASGLALTLAACGPKEPAQDALNNALAALKTQDAETSQKYFGADVLDGSAAAEATGLTADMGPLLQNFSYEITVCEEDGDSATATVALTNTNMADVMDDFLMDAVTQTINAAFQHEPARDAEAKRQARYADILASLLADPDRETVTNTATLNMTCTKGQWQIATDADFADQVLGGLYTCIDQMEDAFAGMEQAEARAT